MLSSTIRVGRICAMPGSRTLRSGSSSISRSAADHNRVVRRPEHLDLGIGRWPGDEEAWLARSGGRKPICRLCHLDRDSRTAERDPPDVAEVVTAGLPFLHTFDDVDAGGAQPRETLPRDPRIRIAQSGNDSPDAGGDAPHRHRAANARGGCRVRA